MLQAKFTLSFHCFSLMLTYLDFQFATLLSPVWSSSSSGADRGLYQVIRRSISVAWKDQEQGRLLCRAPLSGELMLRVAQLALGPWASGWCPDEAAEA